ncbi:MULTISPECIES: 2-oxoacid:ferredoxin oxidoreductase subunit beta [unclassified Halanaerobium]|uniref:2-oxoacid:ferredoxin oxidoreductase subunit beta n=1 Tax=unclassified Halanaerobium TaxID=2641197 RepID=UPI000DF18746|nr:MULTISPECIES: 2-oxoacid:ferredoxin oxidoreductase subunit beta [unclassified Halanaerobium]RCW48672.1 2-oxoglutarate ferredoxin oxidoreductase subunit beta [Halanaerobium sp. MA284_MarDTE_T2]RCW86584.1 2-oxoglutarate ferredoxin oxidoreductase subunit beta [Halanaerobium sp. DL-01]
MAVDIYKYLREDKLPHIWCPGCGHGTILNSLVRAIDQTDIDPDKTVVVSGIGCSGRAPGYLKFDTLHTTHGRAIAFATGIKLANPELNVIVLTGDGDGSAIGGNHLIHGCRRNIDLTVILFNNQIYGMTGGQYSPMTPTGAVATTSPYGNIDQDFDLVDLTRSAGATFVARGATYNPRQMTKLYKEGLEHKGFSFIETLDQCPVNYGRKNNIGGPTEMLDWQKEHTVPASKWEKMPEEEKEGIFPLGVIHRKDDPESEYTARYQQIIDSFAKEDE